MILVMGHVRKEGIYMGLVFCIKGIKLALHVVLNT